MVRPSACLLLALGALVVACGDPSAEERFRSEVAPVLERRCLSPACHGVAPGAEVAGEVIDRRYFYVDVDDAGRIADADAAYENVKARINTVEAPEASTLLRKPLVLEAGGLPHAGGHPFARREDPDFEVVRRWIAAESGGGEGAPPESMTPLQRQFAADVLPVLRDRGCMISRCHGPLGFAGTAFVPPMDGAGGAFTVAEIRANYEAARRNLAIGGDATRSRLLVKALPLDAGGVIHRGGNDTFFPRVGGRDPRQDPGALAIVAWAEAERAAAVGAAAPATPAGLVFVRGPAAPRGLVELDVFRPGSDVYWLPSLAPGATAVNLTAAAHPGGPADVRDPAVSHDGTRVVFAMRTSADGGHDLYEIGLDGEGTRRLTFDGGEVRGGGRVVNRWPVYGPGDRIVFASTAAGEIDETGRALDVELYELREGATPLRLTFTPTPELAPTFLASGEFRGSLAFTTLRRDAGGPARGPIFRFAPDHDRAAHLQPEYHPHHGQTAPAAVTWALRELPDGRDVAVLLDEGNLWGGGALAVIERQLGPDVDPAAMGALSVPGFRHAVSRLEAPEGGLYRDPAPLPDGRVVVAWAPGPVDVTDPAAAPDTGLWLMTLENAPDGAAVVAGRELLADAPGLADDQPVVVAVRPDEDEPHAPVWDEVRATGILRHSGVPVIEAVNRVLVPSGEKPLRADGVAVRLVAFAPAGLDDGPAVDPAQIANGDPASTWWSNGVHGPRRLLAEVPLPADGTLYAELPARTAVRLQLLGADGMAVGATSRLWVNVQGGETFPQGVGPEHYPRLCAGCHGALDGDPASALPPPESLDAITGASVTLSTHEQRNPRRPLGPLPLAATPPADFHFRRDLGPILERSCALAGCHAGATPAGGLALTPAPTAFYDAAYEALQAFGDGSTGGKRWVDERGASAWGSFLMEKLTGRELGAPRPLDFRCPPAGSGAPPLEDAELRAFARWIDLGAIYRTPGVEEP